MIYAFATAVVVVFVIVGHVISELHDELRRLRAELQQHVDGETVSTKQLIGDISSRADNLAERLAAIEQLERKRELPAKYFATIDREVRLTLVELDDSDDIPF